MDYRKIDSNAPTVTRNSIFLQSMQDNGGNAKTVET